MFAAFVISVYVCYRKLKNEKKNGDLTMIKLFIFHTTTTEIKILHHGKH